MAETNTQAESEPPRNWVENLLASEESVRSFLDETQQAHLVGNHHEVRQNLRAFGEAERGIFRVVAFSVLDIEQFYQDLRDQYEGDSQVPIDEVNAIGRRYKPLSNAIEVILTEQLQDTHNPVARVKRTYRYSRTQQTPTLEYGVFSGEVELCEFVHYPSQALMLAAQIIDGVADLLERTEQNHDTVPDTERDRLSAAFERLDDSVKQTGEFVETERAVSDQYELPESSEEFEDRSFY